MEDKIFWVGMRSEQGHSTTLVIVFHMKLKGRLVKQQWGCLVGEKV
jgi:hypothetical protein